MDSHPFLSLSLSLLSLLSCCIPSPLVAQHEVLLGIISRRVCRCGCPWCACACARKPSILCNDGKQNADPFQPGIPTASTARTLLAGLKVATPLSGDGYSRTLFPTWETIEGTCNARWAFLLLFSVRDKVLNMNLASLYSSEMEQTSRPTRHVSPSLATGFLRMTASHSPPPRISTLTTWFHSRMPGL